MVKSYLDENNIAYQELNVAEDKAAREEMIQKSGKMAVPLIDIDGDFILGFNKEQLNEKLGL
jgi:glutaredoxin